MTLQEEIANLIAVESKIGQIYAIADATGTFDRHQLMILVELRGASKYFLRNNPNTPPMVKLYLQGGYGEMTLTKFLAATESSTVGEEQ